MEIVISVLILAMIIAFLCIYCKNATINININYPEPKFYEVKDYFDADGNPIDKDTKATIDDVLKEVNSIMLGREDNSDE